MVIAGDRRGAELKLTPLPGAEARAEHLRTTVVQCCAQTVDAVFAALRGEG